MLDGLWVGEWQSNINNILFSTGVLVFRQGKVFGGNDRVYIVGSFNSDGNRLEGKVRVTYYAGEPLGIFGLVDIDQTDEMSIAGVLSGDAIKLEGVLKSNSKIRLQGLLQKKTGEEIF